MLLQSPPPDKTIFQGFDFASELDRSERLGLVSGLHRASLAKTVILDAVSQTAIVRPVVFNREQALRRLGGLPDLLVDVMRLIQVESPKVHSQIHRTLAERNAVELKRAAHTLKGTASIVGAVDLMKRLTLVEKLAADLDFDTVACELPEIDRQFADLQACVTTELQQQF